MKEEQKDFKLLLIEKVLAKIVEQWVILKNVFVFLFLECTERPRKSIAKFSNRNIAADDVVKDLKLDWEGKRDRWNGFDTDMFKEVIE
jgi:hypothetical protein